MKIFTHQPRLSKFDKQFSNLPGNNILIFTLLLSFSFLTSSAQLFQATAPIAAGVQPAVDAFRTALGPLNPNVSGSFGTGRREINWDGVPDALSAPNFLPPDFFNLNSPRGVVLATPGVGFQVSANSATAVPVQFGNINPMYPMIFEPFSPQRLFTPIASNVLDISFFIPGTNIPALTRGFGAVFSDVDLPGVTQILYFDAANNLLMSVPVPGIPGDQTFSFAGFMFPSPAVAHVRIIAGNAALGPNEPGPDLVVEDDFIFGEPTLPSADVTITKTATPNPVLAGDVLTYTIVVQNNGPNAAQNVQVSDVLPAGTTLQSATVSSPFSVSVSGTASFTATTASLASGASGTITVVARVNAGTTGTISNTATVTATTADPNPANNSSTATATVVQPQADLSITKTVDRSTATAGDVLTYTIVVQNNGPNAAQNVQASDVLPAGTTLQSATAAGPFGISVSGNTFTATAASLTSGASGTFTIVAKVNTTTTGTLSNTATVASATTDPNAANNSTTVTTSTCTNLDVSIPDAMALPSGVDPNTVYTGYAPASSITLTAQVSGGTMPYHFTWSNGAHTQSITVSPKTATTYTVTVTDANGCPAGGAAASKTIQVIDVRGGHNLDKVVICHKPGQLNHTLTIGSDGVADHLSHGDKLGICHMALTTLEKPGSVEETIAPVQFSLQSHPNPFNGFTRIQYTIPMEATVNIKVFDMVGREVGALYNGNQPAGVHFLEFNATKLSKGLYYARMIATVNGKESVQIQKLVKAD